MLDKVSFVASLQAELFLILYKILCKIMNNISYFLFLACSSIGTHTSSGDTCRCKAEYTGPNCNECEDGYRKQTSTDICISEYDPTYLHPNISGFLKMLDQPLSGAKITLMQQLTFISREM